MFLYIRSESTTRERRRRQSKVKPRQSKVKSPRYKVNKSHIDHKTMPGIHRSTLWWLHQIAHSRFGPAHPGPARSRSRHRPACSPAAWAARETHRPYRRRMNAPSVLRNQACVSTLSGPAACLKSAPESIVYGTTNREHAPAVGRKVRSAALLGTKSTGLAMPLVRTRRRQSFRRLC